MTRFVSSASLLILGSLSLAAPAFAQTAPPAGDAPAAADDTGMSPFQFSGVVNADNVYVRSNSSENDYPVLKLNKGDPLVVVGQKSEWLKVLPPEGSFCLVGKLWVEAYKDGTRGKVRDNSMNVNVRIGSTLNNMIATVVTTLKAGDNVKIIGEQDEYFKIAPPPGAYVYVNKRFVDMVRRVAVVTNNGEVQINPATDATPPATAPSNETAIVTPTPAPTPADTNTVTPTSVDPIASVPATNPAVAEAAPTTLPTGEAQAAFDSLETRFMEASSKPIADQPIAELLAGYKMLAADKQLPESILRTAESRAKSLAIRQDLFAEYQKSQAEQAAAAAKQMPMVAEAKEIDQRMKDSQVRRYAAVGTLHTSALPYNGQTLYRLTDPANGRTVVYIVTADPAIKAMEGQFVGVRGEVVDDSTRRIRFIQPTSAEAVEQGEIARGLVSSGLMPSSLMAASSSAAQ